MGFLRSRQERGAELEKKIVGSHRYVGGGMRLLIQPYGFMGLGERADQDRFHFATLWRYGGKWKGHVSGF
jgi:hypothetical protein